MYHSDPGPGLRGGGAATRARLRLRPAAGDDDARSGNPAQLKRYPTAATAKAASAGAVTAAAAAVLGLAGPGAGAASDAVATPTSDEATAAAVAAAARILSLRVAAIFSLAASFSIERWKGRRGGAGS